MIDTGLLWLGTLSSYLRLEEALVKIEGCEIEARSGGHGYEGEDPEDQFDGYGYMVQRVGSLAVIDVKGSVTDRYSHYNRYFGVVSYEEIRNAATAAANDSGVRAILMHYDTPGGAAAGASETAQHLDWLDNNAKPVHSHTGKSMLSAGYWLGSTGRRITATEMASVGSVGVIAVHKEYTVALEQAGIKATVFREGKYKALGNPYEKLTSTAKDVIQAKLSDYRQFFVDAISQYRGLSAALVSKQIATGAEFWGPEALKLGMVDKIMTLEDVVNQLDGEHNSKLHEVRHTQKPKGNMHMASKSAKKITVMTDAAQQAIAAGMPEEEALAMHGRVLTDEEAEAAAKAEADAAAAASADPKPKAGEADEEGEGGEPAAKPKAGDSGSEGSGNAPAPKSEAPGTDVLAAQLATANDKLVDARVELKTATTKLATLEASVGGLLDIARSAVNKMQIAMGGTPMDLTGLAADALISQHASTLKAFNEKYPVGGKATASAERPDTLDTPDASPKAAAVRRASQFNPQQQ